MKRNNVYGTIDSSKTCHFKKYAAFPPYFSLFPRILRCVAVKLKYKHRNEDIETKPWFPAHSFLIWLQCTKPHKQFKHNTASHVCGRKVTFTLSLKWRAVTPRCYHISKTWSCTEFRHNVSLNSIKVVIAAFRRCRWVAYFASLIIRSRSTEYAWDSKLRFLQ